MIHKMMRRVCSDCGSSNLKWGSLGLLADLLPMTRRKMAVEGIAYFGSGARAWMCRKCHALGIFQ